jgi:hypothetical protein
MTGLWMAYRSQFPDGCGSEIPAVAYHAAAKFGADRM